MNIKSKINGGIVYFKRKHIIGFDYALLNDEDFEALSFLNDDVDPGDSDYYYHWWGQVYLKESNIDVDDLIAANRGNRLTIKDTFEGMQLIGFQRTMLDLVEGQKLDPELYDRSYILTENHRYNNENLNKLIRQFSHPYVTISRGHKDKTLKFESSYKYKYYAEDYRDLVMNFIDGYKKDKEN